MRVDPSKFGVCTEEVITVPIGNTGLVHFAINEESTTTGDERRDASVSDGEEIFFCKEI